MSNRYLAHENEIAKLKKELAKEFPHARLRDSHTGLFWRQFRKEQWAILSNIITLNIPVIQKLSKIKSMFIPIKINKPGHPDNYLTIAIEGIPIIIYIETKTGKAIQTPEQKQFQYQCKLTGMIYIINRNYLDTTQEIKNHINIIRRKVNGKS